MNKTAYKLPFPLAQIILDYLVTRPYADVFQIIADLSTLEKIDPIAPPPPEEKPKGNGQE